MNFKIIKITSFAIMFCAIQTTYAAWRTEDTAETLANILKCMTEGESKETLKKAFECTTETVIKSLDSIDAANDQKSPEELIDEPNAVVPMPLPGIHCGPQNNMRLTLSIPDGLLFPSGAVINIGESCKEHDDCYSRCRPKPECDQIFRTDIRAKCYNKLTGEEKNFCYETANVYQLAVEEYGDNSYDCDTGKKYL